MHKAKIDKELFEKLAMEDVSDEKSFRSEISKRIWRDVGSVVSYNSGRPRSSHLSSDSQSRTPLSP